MAHQPAVGAVVREMHAAPGALRHLSAADALEHPAGAPAVQEEYGLLSPGHGLLHGLKQRAAEHRIIACPDLLLHVHQLDLGQVHAVEPVCEAAEGVHAGSGPVHSFHRRGSRAQQHQRFLPASPEDGHLTGTVAGGILRLIGALLLFIQNYDTQIPAGCKHGGAGTHHHLGLSLPDLPPLVVPVPGRQAAVKQRHMLAKMGRQKAEELGCQGNLRHQQKGLFSHLQAPGNELQIHRRLSAAGDAVQQGHSRPILLQFARQDVIGGRLSGV